MRTAIAALALFAAVAAGCGGDDSPQTNAGAAYSSCPSDTGPHQSIQYTECAGKRVNGIYCVTDCIYEPGDQSALPLNCTLPVFGPPQQMGICVGSCSECQ